MSNDRIYIDYEDYPVLEEEFEDAGTFMDYIQDYLINKSLRFITDNTTDVNILKTLMQYMCYPIYEQYHSDRIGYLDDGVFISRLGNSLIQKVSKWYMDKRIQEDLIHNAELDKFISNGGTIGNTTENATSGSAVIQKSASTPTGITHTTQGEQIGMDISYDEDEQPTMTISDDYEDKYTNFVGKTNGLHKNDVDRTTDVKRSSNYGLAMDILEKIPYSYINEVLSEVSQHFIQIY